MKSCLLAEGLGVGQNGAQQLKDDKYRTAALTRANWNGPDVHGAIRPLIFRDIWQSAADKDKVLRNTHYSVIFLRASMPRREDPRWRDDADYKQVKAIFSTTINTLEWFQKNARILKTLKVCENPNCKSGHTYFFRVYPNDRYCCNACIAEAKELRREQRDRENQTPPKEYKRDQLSRDRMIESAKLRWARERAKAERLK